jgi:mRNA interferase MazF
MAKTIARGDIWMLRFAPPDKRRPVLVLSRQPLIEVLHTVTVAALTSQAHGSPTEVLVGVEEGLKTASCVNLVNVFTVRRSELRTHVGTLAPAKLVEVCRALAIAVGCD